MLLAQFSIAAAILLMASIDPQQSDSSLTLMALAAVMLGFSSATQDIVIDAYRIESAGPELQAMMSATYIVGYRLAMLLAGAGSLYLAQGFGSSSDAYNYQAWQYTYSIMAAAMLVGVVTTLVIREPRKAASKAYPESTGEYVRFVFLFAVTVAGFITFYVLSGATAAQLKTSLSNLTGNAILSGLLIEGLRLVGAVVAAWLLAFVLVKLKIARYAMVERTYLMPVRDFFERYGWSFAWLLLALIGLYRISDIVLGVISNVFYKDLGFSKTEIADVVIVFGIFMTILGGLIGGLLAARIGVIRIMLLGGVLAAATNLLFMLLAGIGHDMFWLYLVISADNLSAGIASAAFVAFLSSLTNVSFTAMQYAIFSSLMTLIPKSLGGYSGSMVDAIGYPSFFLFTAILGLPVLVLIIVVAKRFEIRNQSS
jgi:PAT family beta-lactamase induction signal transducer AmpG